MGVRRGLALVVLAALLGVAAPAAATEAPPVAAITRDDVDVTTLASGLRDVTNIDIARDGRVFLAERTGRVLVWHQDGRLVQAGRIGVDSAAAQCTDCPGRNLDEGGLHGILLARDFADSGHVYLYYSVPNSLNVAPVPAKHPKARGPQSTEGLFRLSRFTVTGDTLDVASEVPLFENPAEWFHCCHYGGDMEWLADGTLVLSTGDDTISSQSGGYSPRDYRPGQEFNNADLTSQNPADRRGKMLRIDVADVDGDGSMVPADNPFVDDPRYDPYVYAMGFRSPYRFTVDALSDNVITGNVGPDGRYPDPNRGPAAHEEIEVVPAGGGTNHGWPRCIANNTPYNDYNWQTQQAGSPLSCADMVAAAFTYSYTPYPTTNTNLTVPVGVGSAIMAGVAYRGSDGALALPERFDDTLLWFEWSRGAALALPLSEAGTIVNQTPLDVNLVADGLSTPIDMVTGPDGAVYLAEYGGGLYNGTSSRLRRITCAGCTPDPADYGGDVAVLPADPKTAGPAVPEGAAGGRGVAGLGVVVAVAAATVLRRRKAVVA